MAAVDLGDGLENVERAGADIAINDAKRGENRDRLEPLQWLQYSRFGVGNRAQRNSPRPKWPVGGRVVSASDNAAANKRFNQLSKT